MEIASRISDLARIQAYSVGEEIKRHYPKIEIKYNFRESLGDKNLTNALWQMPEKGVFTQDFLQDLIEEKCDLVVHSWKDLPIEAREQTEIIGTLEREDMRDLLLFRKDKVEAVKASRQLKVLSSSPRREFNLKPFLKSYLPFNLKEIEFIPVRGNMPTRLNKLFSGEADALILAKAAWDRISEATRPEFDKVKAEFKHHLKNAFWCVLPLSLNPAAAAQGALAIEIKKSRLDLKQLLQPMLKPSPLKMVEAEREVLKSYGGGCHQKIGVSCLDKSFGVLKIEKGEHQNQDFHRIFLKTDKKNSEATPPEVIPSLAFPESRDLAPFFERQDLNTDIPKSSGYWITRENVWSEKINYNFEQKIWTAGLKTWRALAQKGIWVNGSSESLGEQENPQIQNLTEPGFEWLKLTHDGVEDFQWGRAFATYRLVPHSNPPLLKGKKFFYWMSGSSFIQAVKLEPEVVRGVHFCGPGNTWNIICNELKKHKINQEPYICLGFAHWKNILGGNHELVGTL